MIKNIYLIVVIICISCSNYDKKVDAKRSKAKAECIESVNFGELKVCLPYINGMTECYSNTSIKRRAHEIISGDNTILGVYLKNSDYELIVFNDDLEFFEYVVIYGANRTKTKKVSQFEFEKFTGKVPTRHAGMNFLESYSLDKKVNSHIFQIENFEKQMLSALNFILINNIIINLVYVKIDEKSIKEIKSKNDEIIFHLIQLNN